MASSSYGKNVFIDESKVWTVDDFTNFKPLNLDQEASEFATYLQDLNYPNVDTLRGKTPYERQLSQSLLIKSITDRWIAKGINLSKLRHMAKTEKELPALIEKLFEWKIKLSDLIELSEYSVLAKVGHPLLENQTLFSGYANFYLDINYDVGKLPLRLPVVVNNTTSSHGVRLFQSRECVFFLSKTLTDYRIHHPKENFITPVTPFTIEYTFDPYCTDKSGDFSYSSQIGGVDTVSREEVMALLAPNKIIKTIH